MGIYRQFLVIVALLGVSAAGCNENVRPLPIPDAVGVERIVISYDPDSIKGKEVVVKDANRIKRVLSFLKERNSGWEKTWHTFPSPQWTIRLEKGETLLLVLWLGPNWMGGREGQGDSSDNRLRTFVKKDRDELFQILGL